MPPGLLVKTGQERPCKPFRYVPPIRVGFAPFWSENGNRFCAFWSRIGYGLRRNYGCVSMCSSFQFQMNKKESVMCEFEMDFKKSFCCGFNLSNDDIISVSCQCLCCVLWPPPGLKTGMDFRGQVWKRVWKMKFFWFDIGSRFGEPGGTPPPRIPRSTRGDLLYIGDFITKSSRR